MKRTKILQMSLVSCLVTILCIAAIFVFTKPPEKVQGLSVNTTYDTAKLSWKDSAAKSYLVFRSGGDENLELVGSTKDNSYIDKDLQTGTTYTYSVKSCNGVKRSDAETITATPSLEIPEISVDISKGQPEIKISEVDGAEGYYVYRDNVKIATSEQSEYVDTDAPSDQELEYTARAFVGDAKSAAGNSQQVMLTSIGDVKARIADEDIILEWDGNDKYDSYEVYTADELVCTTDKMTCTLPADKDEITLKVVGKSEQLLSPAFSKEYEIVEEQLGNEAARQAAVDWGIKIAADNSYTYGQPTFKCNVCGKMPKRQYTCMPFVGACYAHGAKDPVIMNGGTHIVHTTDRNFDGKSPWKKVGLCKNMTVDDLEVGDVIIRWSSSNGGDRKHDPGHACMYAGNGRIVEAAGVRNEDDQIRLTDTDAAAKRLRAYGSDSSRDPRSGVKKKELNYVMRYVGNGGTGKVIKEKMQNN